MSNCSASWAPSWRSQVEPPPYLHLDGCAHRGQPGARVRGWGLGVPAASPTPKRAPAVPVPSLPCCRLTQFPALKTTTSLLFKPLSRPYALPPSHILNKSPSLLYKNKIESAWNSLIPQMSELTPGLYPACSPLPSQVEKPCAQGHWVPSSPAITISSVEGHHFSLCL